MATLDEDLLLSLGFDYTINARVSESTARGEDFAVEGVIVSHEGRPEHIPEHIWRQLSFALEAAVNAAIEYDPVLQEKLEKVARTYYHSHSINPAAVSAEAAGQE